MSKLSLLEIAQSQLDKTPVIDGQLIVCLDTGNAYRDTTTAHVKIGSDLEVVSDLPLAPLAEKIYYLKPDKLYAYLGGNWTLLNDNNFSLGANKSALNGKAKILLDGAKQSSVASTDKLPTSGQTIGDVYDVGNGMNYAWNGSKWDALGEIFTITKITNTEIDNVLAS